jgi:glycosyltransferase involved in cell wall biosynthesis
MAHYSFVVPIYNDGYLAEAFCEVFSQVMKSYLGCEDIDGAVELIFVNDGSTDDSQERLTALSRSRRFVRVVEFSRNFGHHIAVSCGYGFTSGDFVGLINVDMQDPPDQIPLLLDYLRNSDCDLVIGSRPARKDGFITKVGSRAFYATMNFLTNSRRPTNLAVLRLMTRRFVDVYNRLSEHRPYVNGIEEWLGFKQGYVPIAHRPRATGKSSYTLFRKFRLAFDAILSFSDLPLKLTAGFGLVCSTVGFALCSYLVVARMLSSAFQPGFTATISVVVFLGGVQILSIGLLSLYIGRILQEVQHRPRFVIKSTTNLSGPGR